MSKARQLDWFGKRFCGGVCFYPYQFAVGISFRYWPCIFTPSVRIHFALWKVWFGVMLDAPAPDADEREEALWDAITALCESDFESHWRLAEELETAPPTVPEGLRGNINALLDAATDMGKALRDDDALEMVNRIEAALAQHSEPDPTPYHAPEQAVGNGRNPHYEGTFEDETEEQAQARRLTANNPKQVHREALEALEDVVLELEKRGHDEIRRSPAYRMIYTAITAPPTVPEGFGFADITSPGYDGYINLLWGEDAIPVGMVPPPYSTQIKSALAQHSEPGRIPEGYCLVPVEPTESMVEIGAVELSRHVDFSDCIDPPDSEIAAEIYSDMLAAAPAPDTDEREDG